MPPVLSAEPLAVSLRPIKQSGRERQKIIYWFAAVVEEGAHAEQGTQMRGEDFEKFEISINDAKNLLTFRKDKELVHMLKCLLGEVERARLP